MVGKQIYIDENPGAAAEGSRRVQELEEGFDRYLANLTKGKDLAKVRAVIE